MLLVAMASHLELLVLDVDVGMWVHILPKTVVDMVAMVEVAAVLDPSGVDPQEPWFLQACTWLLHAVALALVSAVALAGLPVLGCLWTRTGQMLTLGRCEL